MSIHALSLYRTNYTLPRFSGLLPHSQAVLPQVDSSSGDQFTFAAKLVSGAHFGLRGAAKSPYQGLTFYTDFSEATPNDEALNRFRRVYSFATLNRRQIQRAFPEAFPKKGIGRLGQWPQFALFTPKSSSGGQRGVLTPPFPISSSFDIPAGHINYSAYTLNRLAADPNHELFVHVTDPGVNNKMDEDGRQSHDRTILVTQHHGTIIGPNNGSLSLITQVLDAQHELYTLLPIDIKKVEALERFRLNDPNYQVPDIFHGRDVFAVIAGALAAGINPRFFSDTTREGTIAVTDSDFSKNQQTLTAALHQPIEVAAFADRNYGDVKTSLVVPDSLARQLLKENAVFRITAPNGKSVEARFKNSYTEVGVGEALIYRAPAYSTNRSDRYAELAINCGNLTQVFDLGADILDPRGPVSILKIERIQ